MSDEVDMKALENAAKALQNWFKSQELTVGEAGVVMAMLMGKTWVDNFEFDIKKLNECVKDFNECLMYEIAGNLRERMKK